ncbi:hypothetical protein [Acinetobacter guillouiae]|uniref:hypothetical protein n=1 Tax=Acinetobacter guillouiae TaxID=106649 RepID=UPI002FDA7E0F
MYKMISSSTFLVVFLLVGCNTVYFDLLRDQKFSRAFTSNSTKESINREFGPPIAGPMITLDGKGECYDYNYTLPSGSTIHFYANFRNIDNKLVGYSTNTCQKAKEAGQLNSDEPMKQRF